MVRFGKMLFKALNLISPTTSNSKLKGPELGEGVYLDDEVTSVCLIK